MSSSSGRYCHVLSREDGHVLRRALDFEVEGQGRNRGHARNRLKKKV